MTWLGAPWCLSPRTVVRKLESLSVSFGLDITESGFVPERSLHVCLYYVGADADLALFVGTPVLASS